MSESKSYEQWARERANRNESTPAPKKLERNDSTEGLREHWRVIDDAALRSANARAGSETVSRRNELMRRVEGELDHAYAKHGEKQWGRHEFYAILKEEVDELWDAIKSDLPQDEIEAELMQVAAMCFRYYETGDRYLQPLTANQRLGKESKQK